MLNYENSAIRLSGLIKAASTHHRLITFKIPWPFRISHEMSTHTGAGTVQRELSADGISGVIWKTYRVPNSVI